MVLNYLINNNFYKSRNINNNFDWLIVYFFYKEGNNIKN